MPSDPTKGTFGSGGGLLCLAPPRSGSTSMSQALVLLGCDPSRVHHGMLVADQNEWVRWSDAAWANMDFYRAGQTRRTLPRRFHGRHPARWTRAEWDRLIGDKTAVTDIGAMFAPYLLEAYPDAKIVLVDRDSEAWARSIRESFLDRGTGAFAGWNYFVLGVLMRRLLGGATVYYQWDIVSGFLEADSPAQCRENLARRHAEHYSLVRRAGRGRDMLEFKLSDGWGPLCRFLGKPVPDAPFPRANEKAALKAIIDRVRRRVLVRTGLAALQVAVFGVTVWAAVFRRQQLRAAYAQLTVWLRSLIQRS